MRHLVTGGAGFLGAALTHQLVAEGEKVTVLDRMSRGKWERLPKAAKVLVGDIRNGPLVRRAVMRADVVWHLAYVQGTQTFYADPKDVISVALGGIVNVMDGCELHPGQDLILVSSSEVYQNPPEGMYPTDETVPLSVPDVTNPRYSYGGGKIASELAVMAYARAGTIDRAVIVRPHNIYGPDMGWDHVIPQFAQRMAALPMGERAFPIQGSGLETRSFCYISDCVSGLLTAWRHGEDRTVYHLGNPAEEHTISDLAHMVGAWYGREVDVVPGVLPPGSPTRRCPDISRLRALGWEPEFSLDQGLDLTLRWYKEQSV